MCDCVFFFIPPFLSYFLFSTFSSLISSHLPAFLSFSSSSIYAAHLSFPPFLLPSPLPLPLIFTPSYSSLSPPPPCPPPYPLPPLLSSRYRPHRGVLRLPLRRLRSDHGATASPTEHRDHAAHRQDDRGGKNTLMSSSFCMLSHVAPVTILHQLNVLKFNIQKSIRFTESTAEKTESYFPVTCPKWWYLGHYNLTFSTRAWSTRTHSHLL